MVSIILYAPSFWCDHVFLIVLWNNLKMFLYSLQTPGNKNLLEIFQFLRQSMGQLVNQLLCYFIPLSSKYF